ncbi:septation ring formation regulator EzrA [Bacillaceae bacterium SIJ1]|uniref:septation ring formation regulator EzrA n=1 Tax=Litoribacterium kuwaitense TaxID=1398745 RepID=UPI0013EC2810|nr:septation ring formation regulator EzrA [Litoribacterium kuwaitense]NGP44181.1 septation ring formation regulator EzrA [Litoribacterium kuwaitense]
MSWSVIHWIILTLVVLLVLLTAGMIRKRQIYKQVERFEEEKNLLLNGDVPAELAKVKQLKLTGETEKNFEKWRELWETIVTEELPLLEEKMFDTEEAADRYRFRKAGRLSAEIKASLEKTQQRIDKMLTELQDLIGSEEKNRVEIDEFRALHQSIKKTLLVDQRKLGPAAEVYEKEVNSLQPQFTLFEEKTEEGNYFEARDVLFAIKDSLHSIEEKIAVLPELRQELLYRLPEAVKDLEAGLEDMQEQSYFLDHLQPATQIQQIKEELEQGKKSVEQGDVEKSETVAQSTKENVDQLYDAFEQEVYARHFNMQELSGIEPTLVSIGREEERLEEEVSFLQSSYQLDEEALKEAKQTEKRLKELEKTYQRLEGLMEMHTEANTVIKKDIQQLLEDIQDVKESQKQRSESYQALRQDEMQARDDLATMKKQLVDARRLIYKSNLPGVPSSYVSAFEEAEEGMNLVHDALQQTPLDMTHINEVVAHIKEKVERLHTKSTDMVEQAFLVEQLIQYGNKYRTRYPEIHTQLLEAEDSFRNCDYELALEQAASAVESIEPGALRKMEEVLEHQHRETSQ